ncbi:hypothetical protein [Nitrosomonas sp. H1_AOB3]|uniref:hypothetical protein n=1 Tax=Nitrosomonas sp. H1_AOB3 TaxID=2741553 RepID=UPI00193650D0|nr:hypothetical protein [Nitrosomonas sp. H1_AOB3]QOJ08394.1 MAG: hypothetical protein HRU73_02175 [Nitrosomonas sp. H1_AOB3]
MTEEKIQGQTAAAPQPARRRLLKSTVAIPVIMTLHSGAVLARSSNLVGPAAPEDVHQVDGKYACAIPDPNEDQSAAPPYDLGDSPNVFLANSPEECENPPVGGILLSQGAFGSFWIPPSG